jgi:hypothetical protein
MYAFAVMENVPLAEGECISRSQVEYVRQRLFVVPLVEGSCQSSLEQWLVAHPGLQSPKEIHGSGVDRDGFPIRNPDGIAHFLDSSR